MMALAHLKPVDSLHFREMVDCKRLDNVLQNLLDCSQKLYFWSEKMDEASIPLVIDFSENGSVSVPFSQKVNFVPTVLLDLRC